jgi:CRP-like cAMP-binding protein
MQYRNPYIEICIEGQSSVFRGISSTDKEILDQHHVLADFKKGGTIIKGETKPRGVMCLASGKAKVSKTGAGNREQIIRLQKPVNFLCYGSLFSDTHFPFTVTALENSTVVIFERVALSKMIKQNSDLAFRFMKMISEDLDSANNRLISLTQKHVRGRIAESILLMRDVYGTEADGMTIKVLLSRDDIAHLSNMTTSNAIRTLAVFVSEGLIHVEGRKIKITNPARLEAISESGQ